MTDEQREHEDFFRNFHTKLSQIDDVPQVVLNAHFQVETSIDRFLRVAFDRPEYLVACRLNFFQAPESIAMPQPY